MKKNKDIHSRAKANPVFDHVPPILRSFGGVLTLLAGVLSFLLLFKRRQNNIHRVERRKVEQNIPETAANPSPVPAADDDPRIFNLRTLGWFAIFLVGLIGFVLIYGAFLSGMFWPSRSIIVTPAATILPPAPRLEVNPGQGFQAFRATQQAELNGYGWVHRDKGIVHIPIQRAMELIAGGNLPVVQGTPVAVTPQAP